MNKQQKKRFKEIFNNPKAPKEIKNLIKTTSDLAFECFKELKYSDKQVESYLKKNFKGKHIQTGKALNYIYNGKGKIKK